MQVSCLFCRWFCVPAIILTMPALLQTTTRWLAHQHNGGMTSRPLRWVVASESMLSTSCWSPATQIKTTKKSTIAKSASDASEVNLKLTL